MNNNHLWINTKFYLSQALIYRYLCASRHHFLVFSMMIFVDRLDCNYMPGCYLGESFHKILNAKVNLKFSFLPYNPTLCNQNFVSQLFVPWSMGRTKTLACSVCHFDLKIYETEKKLLKWITENEFTAE